MKNLKRCLPFAAALLWMSCSNPSEKAVTQMQEWLKAPKAERTAVAKTPFANVALTKADALKAEKEILTTCANDLRPELEKSWNDKTISYKEFEMPLKYKIFGEAPADGRSLYISMHGGGGAPKAVNDQQWNNQIRLYTPEEGVYVAPRATTDSWDLWHRPQIDPMFDQIIQAAVILEGVNPNKVYVMGYSAGGDGTYQIAPRMVDRWAAASMMAGHPGDASPLNLRNIGFSVWMGEHDKAYRRNEIAAEWGVKLDKLQAADPEGYKHECHIVKGKGHWMERQDSVAVPWMATFTRNPFPKKLIWKQDNELHPKMYWVGVPKADRTKEGKIIATYNGNTINIEETNYKHVQLFLNDQMMNLDEPVKVTYNGQKIFNEKVNRTIGTIYATQAKRFDPKMVFTAQIDLTL
ncbi:alpha/beta hydrolase [Prolixibacteraceae bacterium JC049]|nr:alpha/beta hydrolase [Prolixibacteraceae bacterium JC049]